MNIKYHKRETWTVEDDDENEFELRSEPVEGSIIIEKIEGIQVNSYAAYSACGYTVKYLVREDYPQNPRTEFDNMGTMLCFSRRHDLLGDKHSYDRSDFNSQEELEELIERDYGKIAVILPVYMYDHSGITIATHPFNDCWDSGQVGVIFVTEEKVIEEYGDLSAESIKKARDYLNGEVELYNMYITGDVYIAVTAKFDEGRNEIDDDSCGGFYGYENAMESLKSGNY